MTMSLQILWANPQEKSAALNIVYSIKYKISE